MTAIKTNGIGKASTFHLNLTKSVADDPAFLKRHEKPYANVHRRVSTPFYIARNADIVKLAHDGVSVDRLKIFYRISEARIIAIIRGRL